MSDTYKLKYGNWSKYHVTLNLGPINTWSIPDTTTDSVSYSSEDTISLNGKGGHYETVYKAFTVERSGQYTISYDYNLPAINFYGTDTKYMHFGIFISTNEPPGGNMSTYADYTNGNCNGYEICGPSSQNNSPGIGNASFTYNLTAGTTYYLWIPMMNLADGVQTYLTFTDIVCTEVEESDLFESLGTCIANLYNVTKKRKYKSFKWELSGRWNQGSGNSGATATYMEWDELGIGFDGGAVCYGPSYWTLDSYTLDGTPWAASTRMPPVLLGGSWGTETSKFDASNFVSLVLYFHTTSGEAILPTSIGLYSTSNQNEYQSSTPLHFILSGLNEETNEYEQLIDIGAANVNKGNTQLTTISSGFTYHYYTIENLQLPVSFTHETIPDYTLLQSDLRTLSLTNAYQTLGSSIDLSNMAHRFLCIKFGATNNQYGAGVYDVSLSPANISGLRWHSYSSRIRNRAPLSYGLNSVSVNHNAYYVNYSNSELYFATNSTAFSSGVWAEYKIIIDLDTGRVRTWVTNADSYIEYYISHPVTTFNCVSCNGDSGSYRSAIRNLYVYSAKTWDIATQL